MRSTSHPDTYQDESSSIFNCQKCALPFDTFNAYIRHKGCCKSGKGSGKKSSKKKAAAARTVTNDALCLDDSNANLDSSSVVQVSL
jgi:hypothetical protein